MREPTIFPDCMMPDGAEPCKGYQILESRLRRYEAEKDPYAPHNKQQLDEMAAHINEQAARIRELEGHLESLQNRYAQVTGENDTLRVELDRLRTGYAEAIEDIESWGAYAPEYFAEKHDLAGTLARHRAALASDTDGGERRSGEAIMTRTLPDCVWLDTDSGEQGFYGDDHYTGDTVYAVSDAAKNPWPEGEQYIRVASLRCKHGIRWPHECRDCFLELMPTTE